VSSLTYRREVDGVRALAVVPVILFHAGFEEFSGGYVGVDVFFVISGYLITWLILAEMQSGTFSIARFYERRARRILPALFFVMAVSFAAAWSLLLPDQMEEFSRSLAAMGAFASNVLFWSEAGYFNTANELKPLLHTWSLAVEEQFYVLFPLLLLFGWRFGRKAIVAVVAATAVASLAFAEITSRSTPEAAFFLLPGRAWELSMGALIAFYLAGRRPIECPRPLAELLCVAALSLIAFSIFTFDELTPFPGLYGLLPTVGTALLLLYASPQTRVGRVLGSKPLVGVGLISYSAYLWHQPVFAFFRQQTTGEPDRMVMLGLSLASLGLACLSWRFVEQPFRTRGLVKTRVAVFVLAGIASVAFVLAGIGGHVSHGFEGRYAYVAQALDGYQLNNRQLRNESWAIMHELLDVPSYEVSDNEVDRRLWFSDDAATTKVLIVGNSHSRDLFTMFYLNAGLFPDLEFARYGMQLSCLATADSGPFFQSPNYRAADIVLVSTAWRDRGCRPGHATHNDFTAIELLARAARTDGKLLALTSLMLRFPQSGTATLSDRLVLEALAGSGHGTPPLDKAALVHSINRTYYDTRNDRTGTAETNELLRLRASQQGLILLEKEDFVCDAAIEECFGVTAALKKNLYDHSHVTREGARQFGQRIHAIDWLRPILDEARKMQPLDASGS
jgi:peptidoglycan/LPS O-acetylase OafA/YrhL